MEDQRYRTGLRRVSAALIDYVLLYTPVILLLVYFRDNRTVRFIAFYIPLIQIFYSILGHYFFGQTIGKAAAKVKVVDHSEENPISFPQAVLRDSVWLLVVILDLASKIFHRVPVLNSLIDFGLMHFICQMFLSFWTIVEIISMMTNKKRRAIHDFIGGTVVIKVA